LTGNRAASAYALPLLFIGLKKIIEEIIKMNENLIAETLALAIKTRN